MLCLASWDAHNLNAPRKFLASAPRHDTPKRARAYPLTDQVVTETAARSAISWPGLDAESQRAIRTVNDLPDSTAAGPAGDIQGPEAGHRLALGHPARTRRCGSRCASRRTREPTSASCCA